MEEKASPSAPKIVALSADALANAVRVEVGRDYAMSFVQMSSEEQARWARKMARKLQSNQKKVQEMGYRHDF